MPPRARLARRPAAAIAMRACVAVSVLALVGCGSSGSNTAAKTSSTSSSHGATGTTGGAGRRPTIVVSSSAGKRYGPVNAHYTCHGANVSPSIEWTALAPEILKEAKEVLVFVRTISRGPIITNWALAGINPSVTKIAEGQTPAGAIVGRNSFGSGKYSVCPPAHATVAFVTIGVYALPDSLGLKAGFNPETVRPRLESNGVSWGGLTMLSKSES